MQPPPAWHIPATLRQVYRGTTHDRWQFRPCWALCGFLGHTPALPSRAFCSYRSFAVLALAGHYKESINGCETRRSTLIIGRTTDRSSFYDVTACQVARLFELI